MTICSIAWRTSSARAEAWRGPARLPSDDGANATVTKTMRPSSAPAACLAIKMLRIRLTPPSRLLGAWIEQAVQESTILFRGQVADPAGPLERIGRGDVVQD